MTASPASASPPRPAARPLAWLAYLPALIVLGTAALSLWTQSKVREAEGWVRHTRAVLHLNDSLIQRLVDLESGQRGYVLTGDERFLEPYRGSADAARTLVGRLATLTADNPAQQVRLAGLKAAVEREIGFVEKNLATLRGSGRDSAVAGIAGGEGRELMERVRGEAAQLAETEHRLLTLRSETATRQSRIAIVSAVLGT